MKSRRNSASPVLRGIALLLACAMPMQGQARFLRASDNDTLPSKPPTARLAYGTDSLQFGELRLPDGPGPFPVAVVIHGGCWVARYASVRNSAALADALRDAGVATWNIEYRRLDSPGGGWPNTFLDAAQATEHLRTLAASYPLDLSRVVTIGHSAGGQLAVWLAGAARVHGTSVLARAHPLPLKGAVALAGVMDLADFRNFSRNSCGDVIDPLMGGTPEQFPERYAAVSPIALLPLRVPHLQIVGSADRVVPATARAAYDSATKAAGSPFELVVLEGLGHHELLSPRTSAWPVIRDAVLRLLRAP